MALNSKIDWTDHSWNPWVGCSKVSEGCANCYMFRDQKRFGKDPMEIRRTSKATWNQVKKFKVGDKVFVCSWSDFFHEGVNPMWRESALDVIQSHPDITWMLLTKRPENIGSMLPGTDHGWPWPNVWLGVTAENQEMYDLRWPILSQIPAAVRFVSGEPLLSAIDTTKHETKPNWFIAGGESGTGARPMQIEWARSLRDQCQAAGVPLFMKQMSGKTKTARHDIPSDLMIREYPPEDLCEGKIQKQS